MKSTVLKKQFIVCLIFIFSIILLTACGGNTETDGDSDSIDIEQSEDDKDIPSEDGDSDNELENEEPKAKLSISVKKLNSTETSATLAVTVTNSGNAPAYNVRVIPISEAELSFAGAYSESVIIEKYEGDQGRARLEKRDGLLIAHLTGDHYQMGYQHGVLLGHALLPVFNGLVTTTALELGFGILDVGMGFIEELKNEMEPYTPARYIDEMHGIADGAASVGCPLDFDDIFMLNVIIDASLIIYKLSPPEGMNVSLPYNLEHGPDCSSFAVWGDASADQTLISAAIQEYTPYKIDAFGGDEVTKDYRGLLLMGRPATGNNFMLPTVPGMVGIAQGLNAAGIATSSKGSSSINATMCGCGINFESREIAQYASSIEDAVEFLSSPHNRARGHNRQIDDADANRSVILEVSATELAIRESFTENSIVASNHFRAWPGFEGYQEDGHNMVEGQFAFGNWGYGTEDISSMENWKVILSEKATRFNFYRDSIEQKKGQINVEMAKSWLSMNRGKNHYTKATWSKIYTDVALYKTQEKGDIYTTGELGPSHRSIMLPAMRSAWLSWGLEDLEQLGPWVFVNLEVPAGGEATYEITVSSENLIEGKTIKLKAESDLNHNAESGFTL